MGVFMALYFYYQIAFQACCTNPHSKQKENVRKFLFDFFLSSITLISTKLTRFPCSLSSFDWFLLRMSNCAIFIYILNFDSRSRMKEITLEMEGSQKLYFPIPLLYTGTVNFQGHPVGCKQGWEWGTQGCWLSGQHLKICENSESARRNQSTPCYLWTIGVYLFLIKIHVKMSTRVFLDVERLVIFMVSRISLLTWTTCTTGCVNLFWNPLFISVSVAQSGPFTFTFFLNFIVTRHPRNE